MGKFFMEWGGCGSVNIGFGLEGNSSSLPCQVESFAVEYQHTNLEEIGPEHFSLSSSKMLLKLDAHVQTLLLP